MRARVLLTLEACALCSYCNSIEVYRGHSLQDMPAESAKGVYSFRFLHLGVCLLLLDCCACAGLCNQSRNLIVCGSGTSVLNIDITQ